MYVCMHLCMFVCLSVCMFVSMYVRMMHVCMLGATIQCIPSMLSINVWMLYSGKTSNCNNLDDLRVWNLTFLFSLLGLCIVACSDSSVRGVVLYQRY